MKYELRYFGQRPSDHDVMEMMVAVEKCSGDVCESIEMIQDDSVAPNTLVYLPKLEGEEWKDE